MKNEVPEIAKELFSLISQIKGVKKVSENMTLTYVVVVEDDDAKDGVEQVVGVLAQQAEKFGFELDVVTATEDEVQVAKKKMAEHLSKNSKFRS